MTCSSPIFEGDEGTIFRLTIQECINDALQAVDVSAQTAMAFTFKKPDGATLNVVPSFTTDGTNGQIEYISQTGDIDQTGVWCLQATVTLTTGKFSTTVVKFDVDPKLSMT